MPTTVPGDDPYLGRTIDGRYAIHRLLGRGGMGAVYEARHIALDRRVAVKFLLSDAARPDDIERFRREARAASRIDHENVVRIFDTGTDQDVCYIAMELVDGLDLRKLIAEAGRLEPARATELTRQLLAGLEAIHDAGIVHRDIKPGNLVVTRIAGREVLKIMDFGISKTREPGLTAIGSAIGTPEFMAPEQRTGQDVDHRADLYAAGLTLHVMLTGSLPGEAPTVAHQTPDQVPPELAPVTARALARLPAARFSSAREFAAALAN
nr:serine/threonine protein kinase [Myxococcota bacterium]